MIPGLGSLLTGGAGGFSGSSAASSDATVGAVGFGGFNFQPKGGNLPPVAWIALAAAAGLVAIVYLARKR